MITESDGSEKMVREKVYFKHVNLYDIPRGIVPEQVYDMAEAMREENEQEWKHVIMGEVGDPATMVFPNLEPMRAEDVDFSEFGMSASCWRWFVGMDYGYRPDPTVCVVVGYNMFKKTLWIVDEIRGVQTSQMIRKLVAKGFIKECGRENIPGRPILYKTTDDFLDYFGLSSKDELPKIEEIEEDKSETDLFLSKYKETIE